MSSFIVYAFVLHKFVEQDKLRAGNLGEETYTLVLNRQVSKCRYDPTLFFIIKNQLISAQAQCYYIFQQFEARNVLILFLTVMYFLMAENQLKRLWVLLYTVFLVV